MRPLIMYCSRTGNTAKVVAAMARMLDAEMLDIGALHDEPDAVQRLDRALAGRPLVGLASGIYWARPDKFLFWAANRVDASCPVFAVCTSSMRGGFLRSTFWFLFNRHLKRLGLRVVGRWHCPGHDRSTDPLFRSLQLSKGRPDARDLGHAEEFARALLPLFPAGWEA